MNSKLFFVLITLGIVILLAAAGLISHYSNNVQTATLEESSTTPPEPTQENPAPTCYIGGCSQEICSDQAGVVSTCIYKEEFTCYKTAVCERQADGQCGWTETIELTSCLQGK